MSQIAISRAEPNALLGEYFYFLMSLIIAGVVVFGFSQTVGDNLFWAPVPRPFILWVHAGLFICWLAVFVAQTALVRSRRLNWHYGLGMAAIALMGAMFAIGIVTTITMRKFDMAHDPHETAEFLSIPFNDVIVFTGLAAAGLYWRRRDKETHRRLMLVATCVLTGAGFARFPGLIGSRTAYAYVCADGLILLAIARDLIVIRRVHPAYLYGLLISVLGHVTAEWLYSYPPHFWQVWSKAIVGAA
jgi:hypothetical protein